jgi:LysM repeat protein
MSDSSDTDGSGSAVAVAVEGLADDDPDDAFDADDPPAGVIAKGGRQLLELADVLRKAGLTVREVDGWKQRSRGGNGYPAAGPVGIIVHHTASPASWNGERDVKYMTFDCDVKPMANLYLDRSGSWWVLSAGATNTNGKGGPWGPIPLNSANSRVIGIEAGNNGIGEAWPDPMQDSYVKGVAALAEAYRVDSANILGHHEWAPKRKVDPAGPSRFGTINPQRSWDMGKFRTAVNKVRGGAAAASKPTTAPPATASKPTTAPPPAPKKGATYVVQTGDSWWSIAEKTLGDPAKNWKVLAEANGGTGRQLRTGDVLTIPGATAAKPAQQAPPKSQPAPAPRIPAFPGAAKRPDRGPVVRVWQEALIAHDVIADKPANRDSFYGNGMHTAVLNLQRSWKWSDADGIAGEHTWSKLHGGD